MCTWTITFVVILLGTTVSGKHFMDCPGNRLCCDNEPELPKGCECFSIKSSTGFTNTNYVTPECPEDIDVRFLLYTRTNNDTCEQIKASDDFTANIHFIPGSPIIFITHGFRDKAPEDWIVVMKDAILKKEDANVIMVDWQDGADATGLTIYSTAVANVRTVGAMIAKLVTVLAKDSSVEYEDFHLIGHSLGAHASGMAGKEVKRLTGKTLGRISGLDPAGTGFGEDYKDHVRLNKDDAIFVDVIHTDAEPLFKSEIDVGDVDFWPNGRVQQPSCPEELTKRATLTSRRQQQRDLVGICSHLVVRDYFTSSITDCDYDVGSGCRMGYSNVQ